MWEEHMVSLGGKNFSSTMSLAVTCCPLPV